MLIRTSQIGAPVSQAAAFALKRADLALHERQHFRCEIDIRAIIDGLITGLYHRGDDAP